jgi:hypothetical protein
MPSIQRSLTAPADLRRHSPEELRFLSTHTADHLPELASARLVALIELRSCNIYLRHVLLRPRTKRQNRFAERVPEVGQGVFDLGRNRGVHGSGNQAVALETPQGAGQHLLRDTVQSAFDRIKAKRAVPQQHDDKHTPLVTDARQDLADFAAVFMEGAMIRASHSDVPQS